MCAKTNIHCNWYDEKRRGPGRPPKWVSKLLDKLQEDNDDNGTCIDKDGKDESDDGLMHESTDESQKVSPQHWSRPNHKRLLHGWSR